MSLDNLVGKTLERIEPDQRLIKRLLESAATSMRDAGMLSGDYVERLTYLPLLKMVNALATPPPQSQNS